MGQLGLLDKLLDKHGGKEYYTNMNGKQAKQAQEAVRILTVVSAIALLNEADRAQVQGAGQFLKELVEQELREITGAKEAIVDVAQVELFKKPA